MTSDLTGYETLKTISKADHFNQWMYQTIQPHIKGKILELGSGIGNISQFIIKDFQNVTLSDYDQTYCKYLQDKFVHTKNVNAVINIDLQDVNFKKNYRFIEAKFDTIILLNVIEHLANDLLAVEYCHFLLKQHGHLIVLAPAYQLLLSRFDKDLGHYRRYTLNSLTKVFPRDQFDILQRKYFNFLGAVGWFLLNTLTGRTRIKERDMTTFNQLVLTAKIIDKLTLNKAGLSAIVIGKKK